MPFVSSDLAACNVDADVLSHGFGVSGADIGAIFRGGMLEVPDKLGNVR